MVNFVDSDKLSEFKKRILGLSGGRALKICIFGAGKCGLQIFKELRDRLINVDFFCDNDCNKHGYIWNNKYCISFDELKKYKDDILVIVSPINAAYDIIKQLTKSGFKFVVSKDEIEELFKDIPPVEWFKGLDAVDYSSMEMELIISKFKETIFDVCSYYESKLRGNID